MAEKSKGATTSKQSKTPISVKLTAAADLLDRAQQIRDSIACRAFYIFQSNGHSLGHDLEDWFRAESEFLHPVYVDIAQSDGNLTVRAEVPGFTPKDLNISLEPQRLTITGKRETKEERKDKEMLYSERCSDQILRVINLPEAVDTAKVSATLKDGVFELNAKKAAPTKKVPVKTKV